jgi:nitrite reductase (NADH) large subunit
MADALALNLTGRPAKFTAQRTVTKLKMLGVDVAAAGDPLDSGRAVRSHTAAGYRLLRLDGGRLAGALGVGPWKEFSRIQDATLRRARVWPWQIARFERTGSLWRSRRDLPVTEWASDAVVCNCMTVTRGQLSAAIGGRRTVTVQALIDCTGASTLCGSCRPLLAELAGAGPQSVGRIGWSLLAGSLLALALAAMLMQASPVPPADSVQGGWRVDVDALWRNGTYRQISGFSLLGLAALASLLSIRKRWRRARSAGSFPAWRLAHVLLGAVTLAALAAHTGARTGENLNFLLMACFSAVNVIGGAAGGLTALEQRLGTAAGRRLRTAMVTAHILAMWPLPVLLTLHVVSVYYF